MRLQWRGHYGRVSGYASASYDYLAALDKAGVELDIRPNADASLIEVPERFQHLNKYVHSQSDSWPELVAVHAVPDAAVQIARAVQGTAAPKVCITTWETSKLPEYVGGMPLLEAFSIFTKVFVPCAWNWNAFTIAGIENTYVIPHCFDPAWWFADRPVRHAGAATFKDYKQPCVFYAILSWAERKNPIGLLKAYLTAFDKNDKVLLRIVTPSHSIEEVDALVRSLGLENLPPVEFVGRLTDNDLRQVHFNADCYVSTARGEGWGLGAFEAALVGNAVIAPIYGAFPDFLLHHKSSYWVPCSETPAITPPTVTATKIKVGDQTFRPVVLNTPGGINGGQLWAEPSLDMTKALMRLVYKTALPRDRKHSRDSLAAQFSYEVIGKRFLTFLEA